MKFSDDDSLLIILKIPLINEEYENIEINFDKKKKKEVFEQFKILRSKYLKMKDIVLKHQKNDNPFSKDPMITEIEGIEKENNKGLFVFGNLKDSSKEEK